MTSDVVELLQDAREFVHTCTAVPGDHADDFAAFTEAHLVQQFGALGVYVCGYVFREPGTADMRLLFDETRYAFPYCWSCAESAAWQALIDQLFVVWRKHAQSTRLPPTPLFPPEFISYLPHPGVEVLDLLHAGDSQVRSTLFAHYCSLGEMMFHLYSWRLLLRCAQLNGYMSYFAPGIISLKPDGASVDNSIWSAAGFDEFVSPEGQCLAALEQSEAKVAEAWNDITHKVDDGGSLSLSWFRDWQILGLVASHATGPDGLSTTASLRALVRFGEVLAGKLQLQREARALGEAHAALLTCAPCTLDRLAQLDETLQSVVGAYLFAGGVSLGRLLLSLNGAVRFPLVPYFYWLAVDPGLRCHLVLPVWRSAAAPAPALCYRHEARTLDERLTCGNRDRLDSSLAGVAVLAIRPDETCDWTLSADHMQNTQVSLARLASIRDYIVLLSAVPIDEVYYGQLAKRMYAVDHSQYLKHEVMDSIGEMRNELELLWVECLHDPSIAQRVGPSIRKREVFRVLFDWCIEEIENFSVLGGRPLRPRKEAFAVADVIFALGVLLKDVDCREGVIPRTHLESTINNKQRPINVRAVPETEWSIRSDRLMIVGILRSLVSNAATAMKGTNDPIDVAIESTDNKVILTVSDTGVGIPSELADRIYALGFSTKLSVGGFGTKAVARGHGIGLFLVHQFCEALGGWISYRPNDTRGTVFTVELPAI